jgi:hypothetical protein
LAAIEANALEGARHSDAHCAEILRTPKQISGAHQHASRASSLSSRRTEDLAQAGHSWLDRQPLATPALGQRVLVGHQRTRTHKAHIALDHVD